MQEKVFRRPNAWRRSLIVNDAEWPLTDRECDALLEALARYRRGARSGITYSASSILYFLGTGRYPREDDRDLAAWRRRQRRAADEGQNSVEASEFVACDDDDGGDDDTSAAHVAARGVDPK